MKKITFKEYYDSKTQLLEAIKENPKHSIDYILKKYCKLPILESIEDNEEKTIYYNFKPKDKISVIWEYFSDNTRKIDCLIIENKKYFPFWKMEKFETWTKNSTREKQGII